jgi:hypothetical protein
MRTITNHTEHDDSKKLQKLYSLQDISIWIDSYDDIFSDFDPRPFSERNISDDFLNEVKKVSLETDLHINELKLLIPEKSRNAETENIIIKRLHSFFIKNQHYFLNKKKEKRRKGFLYTLMGTALMVGASLISAIRSASILMHTLLVILEPAGWFFVWFGMENLITTSKKEKPELDFYIKMSRSKIAFFNIR